MVSLADLTLDEGVHGQGALLHVDVVGVCDICFRILSHVERLDIKEAIHVAGRAG